MRFQVGILEIGIGYALIATSLVAQKETFVPASDVSFKISVEQTAWEADKSITLK